MIETSDRKPQLARNMTTMITVETIRQIIEENMEDTDRAERLFNALKPFDGEVITQPIADKIKEVTGEARVSIRRHRGMTQLEIGGYGISNPDPGLLFIMGYSEKNVRIDLAFVTKHNTCYLDAAKERNAKRQQLLDNTALLANMAHAIEQVNEGLAKFREMTDSGQPFSVISHSLKRLIINSTCHAEGTRR